MKKALVSYSGGLDSRLVVRMLQDQGFEVTALYFALPFGCGCCDLGCNFSFTQRESVKMVIMDVNKGELFKDYLELIKNPKFGIGAGINPCKDCKVFMFKRVKAYADEHGMDVIATGEVLGQRPMSQVSSAMKVIDDALGFEILRPLSAKALPETSYEKEGLVDRSKLLDIVGRGRRTQMKMAEEYDIKYPSPGGGCFLCEKMTAKRLCFLLEHNLITEESLPLTMLGRHFYIDDTWYVVGRDADESAAVTQYATHLPGAPGKPAVYFSKESGEANAVELQNAYATGSKNRAGFEAIKL